MSEEDDAATRLSQYQTNVAEWFTENLPKIEESVRAGLDAGLGDSDHSASSLWIVRATPMDDDERAERLAQHPDIQHPWATTIAPFLVSFRNSSLREYGAADCIAEMARNIAHHRLDNDGEDPPEIVPGAGSRPGSRIVGVALTIFETAAGDPDGDQYLSVYMVDRWGDTLISRHTVTGPHTGHVETATSHIAFDHGLQHLYTRVVTGQMHPYLFGLVRLYLVLACDLDALRKLANIELVAAFTNLITQGVN